MKILALLSLVIATPALANTWCDDLWFTRNLVMDQAGYCFGSTLGQTVFDNGDCTGKSVTPDRAGRALVARIQKMEADAACKGRVNTRGRELDVGDIGIRMMLGDLPVIAKTPSACIGWRGPMTSLHARRQAYRASFGLIEPGDAVSFDHEPQDGWIYVTAHDFDGTGPWSLKSGGWVDVNQVRDAPCDSHLP